MSSCDSRVEIALPSDENYVMGLIATAASIALYADPSKTLSINVLDGGIADATFRRFEEIILRLHANSEFHRIPVNDEAFSDLPIWSGNKMTYARLLLPQALPDVDHIIYSDTDFIWTADIAELWRLRDDRVPLQGVLDAPSTVSEELEWFASRCLPFAQDHYFGGGMMMINLRLFRAEGIIAQATNFLKAHSDVRFADQSAINAVLGSRTKMLDDRWQTLSMFLTKEKLLDGCGIHFAREVPWRRIAKAEVLTDPKLMWHWFYSRQMNISVWTSLRQYFSCWYIISRRAAYLIGCTCGLRWLMLAPLKLFGYQSAAAQLRFWCRRIDWSCFRLRVESAMVKAPNFSK